MKWLIRASRLRRRQDLDVAAEPGGLAAAGRRADQAELARRGGDRRRQHAGDPQDRAIERQLAERQIALGGIARERAHADQQRERDRQIEVAALLGQVGGRQIDRDALGRQAEPERPERAAHPLAQFGDRLVGQADEGERRQAGADLHLHVDVLDVDPGERDGAHAGDAERRRTVDRHRIG